MKAWTARGSAAIAVDLEGQIPTRDATGKAWIRTDTLGHEWGGGPARHGNAFGDCFDRPFEEQWTYHAVADTILAFSLLASLPEVDADRIGMVGISCGSVVCTIAAGVDDRPAFVASQYIGGFLNLDSGWCEFMKPRPQTRAWDPANFYTAPTASRKARWLWINGANDACGTPRPGEAPGSFTTTLQRPEGMVTGWVNLLDDRGLAVSCELLAPGPAPGIAP